MGQDKKRREAPTAYTRAHQQISRLKSEIAHFERKIRNGVSLEVQRVLWCRIEDAKARILHLKKDLARLRKRHNPQDDMPLFRDQLKGGAYDE